MFCVQYSLVAGKKTGLAGYLFCLEPVTLTLSAKLLFFFFFIYLMERGVRRRMAAGSKGIKKKELKMTANVKSILLFPSPLQELPAISRVMRLQQFQVLNQQYKSN